MTEFVRIRTESGYEASVSAGYAEGVDGLEVIDAPATNLRGRPLSATRENGRRALPRTTAKKAAAKKAAAKRAASSPAAPTTSGVAATPEEASK